MSIKRGFWARSLPILLILLLTVSLFTSLVSADTRPDKPILPPQPPGPPGPPTGPIVPPSPPPPPPPGPPFVKVPAPPPAAWQVGHAFNLPGSPALGEDWMSNVEMPPFWFEADYDYFSEIFKPINMTFYGVGIKTERVIFRYTDVNGNQFTNRADFIFQQRTTMSGYYSKTGSWHRVAYIFDGTVPPQNVTGILKGYFEITTEYGTTNWPSPSDALKIKITDTHAPVIIPHILEDTGLNQPIYINASISDDVGVQRAVVYYRNMTSQTYMSMNMSLVSGDRMQGNYSAVLPGVGIVGDMFYYIRASDSDNDAWFHNSTSPAVVHIKDITPPQIEHTPHSELSLGSSIIISALISDNVMVLNASVDYRFEGAKVQSISMSRISGDYSSGDWAASIAPAGGSAVLHYRIRATDLYGNTNVTQEYVTNLVDSSAPYIIHHPHKVISTNRSIPIRVVAIDDEAVLNVTLYFRGIGQNSFTAVPLTLYQGDGKYGVWLGEIPAQTQEGIVYYYITASDSTNTARLPGSGTFKTDVEPPSAMEVTAQNILPVDNDLLMSALLATAAAMFVSSAVYEGVKRWKRRD